MEMGFEEKKRWDYRDKKIGEICDFFIGKKLMFMRKIIEFLF